MTNYEQQATDFLNATSTGLTITYKGHSSYFQEDKEKGTQRDIYIIVLENELHRYRFLFGQSEINSDYGKTRPTAYDVLASITKYEVFSFEDFCGDYGYDIDSRGAYKTYKAVLKEWKNIERLFTTDQIELLQ